MPMCMYHYVLIHTHRHMYTQTNKDFNNRKNNIILKSIVLSKINIKQKLNSLRLVMYVPYLRLTFLLTNSYKCMKIYINTSC